MAELKCQDCGTTASYADAMMLDRHETCGRKFTNDGVPLPHTGEEHNWEEI